MQTSWPSENIPLFGGCTGVFMCMMEGWSYQWSLDPTPWSGQMWERRCSSNGRFFTGSDLGACAFSHAEVNQRTSRSETNQENCTRWGVACFLFQSYLPHWIVKLSQTPSVVEYFPHVIGWSFCHSINRIHFPHNNAANAHVPMFWQLWPVRIEMNLCLCLETEFGQVVKFHSSFLLFLWIAHVVTMSCTVTVLSWLLDCVHDMFSSQARVHCFSGTDQLTSSLS